MKPNGFFPFFNRTSFINENIADIVGVAADVPYHDSSPPPTGGLLQIAKFIPLEEISGNALLEELNEFEGGVTAVLR